MLQCVVVLFVDNISTILVLCTTVNFIVRYIITPTVFDSPEMWTTRFHALTWNRNTKNQPDRARREPPSLILQSKFAVVQSRVYIRPGQDIGHYTVHPLCFIKPTPCVSFSLSRIFCRPSLLVASFIYLSNIDRELFLCPSRASRKKKIEDTTGPARGRSSR